MNISSEIFYHDHMNLRACIELVMVLFLHLGRTVLRPLVSRLMFTFRSPADYTPRAGVVPWEKLSPACIRILGLNPGAFTLDGTNTYLIGTGSSRILVDTGEGLERYQELLRHVMELHGVSDIHTILLSHRHGDHVGGVDLIKAAQAQPVRVYKNGYSDGCGISDQQRFTTEGADLVAVLTPGHTEDHCCFILEQDSALLSGDCVLGCGSTIFEDLSAYMKSLLRIQKLCRDNSLTKIYPGHGPVVLDSETKIAEYIKHRTDREAQILAILSKHQEVSTSKSITSIGITNIIYPQLPRSVFPAAQRSVTLHLRKLLEDDKVTKSYFDLWEIKQ